MYSERVLSALRLTFCMYVCMYVCATLALQTHNLTEQRPRGGEKIEGLHLAAGAWNSNGTNGRTGHSVAMSGLGQWNADRLQMRLWNTHKTEKAKVPSYALHEQYVANAVAKKAGMLAPFPDLLELQPDTGECFLFDYFLEQQDREAENPQLWSQGGLVWCPCDDCRKRRLGCRCGPCSHWRKDAATDPLSCASSARALRDYATLPGVRPSRADALRELAVLYRAGKAPKAEAVARRLGIDVKAIFTDPATLRPIDAVIPTQQLVTPVRVEAPPSSLSTASTAGTRIPYNGGHFALAHQYMSLLPFRPQIQWIRPQ